VRKASLEAVRSTSRWTVEHDDLRVDIDAVTKMPDTLRTAQLVFDRTGGLTPPLFTRDGGCWLREDVGRTTRGQGIAGRCGDRLAAERHVLMVTASIFELVQKAVMAAFRCWPRCPRPRAGGRAAPRWPDDDRLPAWRLHERLRRRPALGSD